jgi:hypothetical protein
VGRRGAPQKKAPAQSSDKQKKNTPSCHIQISFSDLGMMLTGDGICKRKSCGSTSDDGRSKRTRKTTKGDGFEQDSGASQRRIQKADTDNVSEDDGSEEFKPDEDGGDSDTDDYLGSQLFGLRKSRRSASTGAPRASARTAARATASTGT